MWKSLVKKLAGYAFQWGLKVLTEQYGAEATVPPKRRGKPKP
jgi:hypothetical protein